MRTRFDDLQEGLHQAIDYTLLLARPISWKGTPKFSRKQKHQPSRFQVRPVLLV